MGTRRFCAAVERWQHGTQPKWRAFMRSPVSLLRRSRDTSSLTRTVIGPRNSGSPIARARGVRTEEVTLQDQEVRRAGNGSGR